MKLRKVSALRWAMNSTYAYHCQNLSIKLDKSNCTKQEGNKTEPGDRGYKGWVVLESPSVQVDQWV